MLGELKTDEDAALGMSGGSSPDASTAAADRRFAGVGDPLSPTSGPDERTEDLPSVGSLVVHEIGVRPSSATWGYRAGGDRMPSCRRRPRPGRRRAAQRCTRRSTCSHIGKAPPCADAIVASGARRVVIATLDPGYPRGGREIAILGAPASRWMSGSGEVAARRAMAGFLAHEGKGQSYAL